MVDSITVLRSIRFTSVRRNEVKDKISKTTVEKVMKAAAGDLSIAASDSDMRQQRAALLLREVGYVIAAHFDILSGPENVAKHLDQFNRRARRGACFTRPNLGCREFAAHFSLLEPDSTAPEPHETLRGERDLGWMLHDIVRAAGERLSWIGLDAVRAASIEEARGHEGLAAQTYFGAFDALVGGDREVFRFNGRSRRPPLDRVNALLSFVYALLRHDIESARESVDLDPAVGFLHADRPGRPSLALDVMEELRAVLADRLVVTLINRRQVQSSGFIEQDGGGIAMDEDTRKSVVSAWQLRKQEELEHPFIKERVPLGLIPYVQALLLARHMRDGLDAYPAFFWR